MDLSQPGRVVEWVSVVKTTTETAFEMRGRPAGPALTSRVTGSRDADTSACCDLSALCAGVKPGRVERWLPVPARAVTSGCVRTLPSGLIVTLDPSECSSRK